MWSYKVFEWHINTNADRLEELLNELGEDGWELITVAPAPDDCQRYLFKRMR